VLEGLRESIGRLEARLRAPRPSTPDAKALRQALEQKTKEWKKVLRSEPRLARMLLRRLVGPITLWKDEPLPEWLKKKAVRWRAENMVAGELPVQVDRSPRGARIS